MTKTYRSGSSNAHISVHRLADLPNADALIPGIEAVFFATGGTKTFTSDEVRDAFRERWLGRFLTHDLQSVYVALEAGRDHAGQTPNVVGYLVGALDDPAQSTRFADLEYFQSFQSHTKKYPAQLHVNLAEHVRGQGHGGRLIEAFVGDARLKGAPGVHVVTGENARNVSFYAREGFEKVAQADWNDHRIVFLGRRI